MGRSDGRFPLLELGRYDRHVLSTERGPCLCLYFSGRPTMQIQIRHDKNGTPTARLYRRQRLKLDETKITPEAHRAIMECLKIAARRGRELRLARERAENNRASTVTNASSAEAPDEGCLALAENSPPQEAGPPRSERAIDRVKTSSPSVRRIGRLPDETSSPTAIVHRGAG